MWPRTSTACSPSCSTTAPPGAWSRRLLGESPRVAQHRLASRLGGAQLRAALDSLTLTARVEAVAAPLLDGLSPARQAMAADRLERLPGEMLSKVEVASMSASLEVRVPLLDDALVRFADGIDERSLVGARWGKLVLRRVLAGLTPGPLAWAKKRGFSVRALLAEERASLERLSGVDGAARYEQFLAGDERGAQPEQILWLAAVARWAARLGVSEATRPSWETIPLA